MKAFQRIVCCVFAVLGLVFTGQIVWSWASSAWTNRCEKTARAAEVERAAALAKGELPRDADVDDLLEVIRVLAREHDLNLEQTKLRCDSREISAAGRRMFKSCGSVTKVSAGGLRIYIGVCHSRFWSDEQVCVLAVSPGNEWMDCARYPAVDRTGERRILHGMESLRLVNRLTADFDHLPQETLAGAD